MRGSMRLKMLLLWTCLVLWLILDFWSLDTNSQIAFILLIITVSTVAGHFQWRTYIQSKDACRCFTDLTLPPKDFQGAVILVCGNSEALFPSSQPFRETRQDWYLPVKTPELLLTAVQFLSAERPMLLDQTSILLTIIPEQHLNHNDFIQYLRTWQRGITPSKRWLKERAPLWIGIWVSPFANSCGQEERWYTVTSFQKSIRVEEAGSGSGSMSLMEWNQQQGVSNSQQIICTTLWMESLRSWYVSNVQSILTLHQGDLPPLFPYLWAVCFTPVNGITNNLWQKHIASVTSLLPQVLSTSTCLPLPETLLPYFPRSNGISRLIQSLQWPGILVGIFLLFALMASFINNQRLIESVGNHLALYNGLTGKPPQPKTLAQQQLREDLHLLDGWLRDGSPIRLSLGLYQGTHLIRPLTNAINSWSPPRPRSLPSHAIPKREQATEHLRLDSLSLFDSGKSALKSESSKVLIKTLIDLQSHPGKLVMIAGHADITGNVEKNQILSQKRAEALRDWMIASSEIPFSCFVVKGYGARHPIASNATAEGRAANRRIEITLLSGAEACPATAHNPYPGTEFGTTTSKEK